MCTRCPNKDSEICSLCGGKDTKWSKAIPILDADHKGELVLKILENIRDKNVEIEKMLEVVTPVGTQWAEEMKGLCIDIKDLFNILGRIESDKLTNADLEYIDCI
jgi:hypothetical protein